LKEIRKNVSKPKRKKTNKKKIMLVYAIGIIVLIYFVYCIIQLIKQPTDVVAIENGNLSEEENAIGYVIREETVIQGENYKNGIVQIKSEGEKVAKDDPVFRYYSNNEETLTKKIQELDIKIQEAMENTATTPTSDMKLLETQIQEKLIELEKLNDIQKIAEYKKDISAKITKRAKIAGDLSPSGSYIRKLIEERSSYESSLNSGSEYINAPVSGIVSYRVDGLEDVLTPDSISTLTSDFLDSLKLKTGEIVSSSGEKGKIINNFEGYIITSLKSEKAKEIEVGKTVKLRLSNSEEISAEVVNITEEENSRLITFKITNGLDMLANYRKITFDVIWWSYSGLKVPNTALVAEPAKEGSAQEGNNIYFVIRNRAGYTDKIPVKILKQNSSYSIITNYESTELKEEWGYTDTEVKAFKSLVLYDEIMIHPKT
jgi:putative membrane fusion protein